LDIIAAVLRDKPVLTLPDGVPAGLGVVLETCLQREVSERPNSIHDVQTRIEACFENPGSFARKPAPAAEGRRVDRKVLLAGVAIVVIFAAAYGFFRWRAGRQDDQGTEAFQHARMIRMTTSGQASDAAISRDGKYVAYVERDALRLREMSSDRDVEIVAAANKGPANLTFSPDGRRIYYTQADGNLYAIPILGGISKKICPDVKDAISFSPGGDEFVISRVNENTGVSGIFLAHADGSKPRQISGAKFPRWVEHPAWSPRGEAIAYAAAPKGFFRHDLVTQVPTASTPIHVLTPYPWGGDLFSAWIDNGSALVLSAEERGKGLRQIWTLTYPSGRLSRVTNDLDEYTGMSATADSRILVSTRTETKTALWVIAPSAGSDSGRLITPATSLDNAYALTWTPDNRIIFTSLASGSNELWVINANGRNRWRLTYTGARNNRARVSHDGKFVLFGSNRTGGTNQWQIALEGTGIRQVTFGDSDVYGDPSPDGRSIALVSLKSGRRLLHKYSIADGRDTVLSDLPIPLVWYSPSFSPDGKLIAFVFVDPAQKRNRFGVLPAQGGPLITSFDAEGKGGPVWTRDGRGLTYTSRRDGVDNLWIQPLAGGPPHQITRLNEGQIWAFAWSWDGKRLVVARGGSTSDVVALHRTD
jgi:Tol biopolymer transport system component